LVFLDGGVVVCQISSSYSKCILLIEEVESYYHVAATFFRFDERISAFAETKFSRDGIEVLTGCRVVGVSNDAISMKVKSTGELCRIPYGMVVWSTGVGTRPVIQDFMEQIGQVLSVKFYLTTISINYWCFANLYDKAI